LELKLNQDTKIKHLIDLIKKYEENGKYSAVVFSCLMTSDLHKSCKDLYGKNFKSISLVPPLNVLIEKRGDRAPTKEIQKLVKQMYNEWGLDKPKTADLIIDNSKITIEQCVNGIIEFLQTGKTKIANTTKSLKSATINMINRLKGIFLRNNNIEM
jgi:adenylylsulfate kinase-like enzyme